MPQLMDCPAALADLESAVALVRTVVGSVEVTALTGDEALVLSNRLGDMERVAASGLALFAPKVLEEGSYAKEGHASGPDWLAGVSGSAAGTAKARLASAEAAQRCPEVTDALRHGTLSGSELGLVTEALGADPDSAQDLLGLVERQASHQELSGRVKEIKAAARSKESEHQRRARVHAKRYFRSFQHPDGGVKGEFHCDEVAWATVLPLLEAATAARLRAARLESPEDPEHPDALRLDAFMDLLGSSGGHDNRARARVIVVIDAEALRRRTTSTGEICEIEGIGPVPVEAVYELLGQGSAEFLVKEGRDVRTLTKASRDVAQKMVSALEVRDRACVIKVCGKRLGLEMDHCSLDYGQGGPTELENLALLCRRHHDMKTYGGWTLERRDGEWLWIAPEKPPSAAAIARRKKVAVAKAQGKRQHNSPRRD